MRPKSSSIQVFLSPTFVDMTEERKFVVERTLPELSRRCRELGLELREIDLRWGITADSIQAGTLIELSWKRLTSLRSSLPLLGHRYGTTINTFAPRRRAMAVAEEHCRGEHYRNRDRVWCSARR